MKICELNKHNILKFYHCDLALSRGTKFGFMIFYFVTLIVSACGDSFDREINNSTLPIEKISPIDEKEMVLVPAGDFIMGTNKTDNDKTHLKIGAVKPLFLDQHPTRKIFLDAYYIDKYEVTNADYRECFVAGVCEPEVLHEDRAGDFNKKNQPVVFTTWQEAMTYCKWKNGRLPTEAEWEYAAKVEKLGGGHWNQLYGVGATVSVGSFKPNSHGLYDMMGNVYEWTLDWYGSYETAGTQSNPSGPVKGKDKVVRGGSWDALNHFLRTSDRVAKDPDLRYSGVGFRCVRPNI